MNSSRETRQILQLFVLHLELVMKLAESQQLGQPHTSSPATFNTQPHSSLAVLLEEGPALLEEGPVVLVACLLGFPCSLSLTFI